MSACSKGGAAEPVFIGARRRVTTLERLLPGVPKIESPIFDCEFTDGELDSAETQIAMALHQDGFAVLDFPDSDIDSRISRIRNDLDDKFADLGVNGGVVYNQGRIQDAWRVNSDVQAIAANPTILALLGKLYGRPAFPFQTLNFKVGTQQALHTDAVHFSSVPARFMCGVWVALEDISVDAGPLHYLPGSHRWQMIDNSMLGRRGHGNGHGPAQDPYQLVWDAMTASTVTGPQTFLAKKGQALIWSANLLHGGSRQIDPSLTRWSQVTHYYFDDCIYYTPSFSDEYLGRLELREPVNVVDGLPRRNSYLGEEIHLARPAPKRQTLTQRLASYFR